ncbi:complement C1q-like protein 4 [Mercenaria mercenaria]|uniref:complement C1q-like protein 4 n=1 Tax=Mercenaria mercenaria TaxID=6596 RepID=UPI00234F3A20|nr:complement C1q-like protein 4 [Mercenaria mercenaria]
METCIIIRCLLISLIAVVFYTTTAFAHAEVDDFLLQRLSALESKHRDLQNTIDIQKKELHELKRTCSSQETSRYSRALNGSAEYARISFTAILNHDVNDPNQHQTIKFNQVITNEGNGYDIHTGVFACPESGMYLLSVFAGERGIGGGAWVSIRVNSVAVVEAVVETFHDKQDLQGGNVVLKRLNKGDTVWVEAIGNHDHVERAPTVGITTFSGVYLYP